MEIFIINIWWILIRQLTGFSKTCWDPGLASSIIEVTAGGNSRGRVLSQIEGWWMLFVSLKLVIILWEKEKIITTFIAIEKKLFFSAGREIFGYRSIKFLTYSLYHIKPKFNKLAELWNIINSS